MTLTQPAVRRATAADAEAVTHILATGFRADPPLLWILPDAEERERLSPAFFQPFVDLTLADGQVYVTEDHTGAALWLDVDVTREPDDAEEFREIFLKNLGPENAQRFFMLDELFSAGHPTHESHAYLLFAGVVADRQSQGIGTAVLQHRLTELDAAGQPAYVEASTTRNARLYARLGFQPHGQNVVLPDGPTLYPMWRPTPAQQQTFP